MPKIYSYYTGQPVDLSNVDQARSRIARMRVRVWWGVKALREVQDVDGGELHMLTLTYRRVGEWSPRHISGCMRWARAQGVRSYVWVAELQKRGAVHYHALVLWPKGVRWVKPSTDTGGWERGYTWVTPNVKKPFYIMKYLQKAEGNNAEFPKGIRLYGVSLSSLRRLSYSSRCAERLSMLPRWFATEAPVDDRALSACRVRGGVRWGGRRAISPFGLEQLTDIDTVGAQMYTRWWGNNDIAQP